MANNIALPSAPLAGIEPLQDLLYAVIGSAFVTNSVPISCMIVAPSGAGKSRTLIKFDSPYIVRADDLTSSGLIDILQNDKDNKIKYLLIPDFNPVLSHKASVSSLLMANLLSVTQDGTARVVDGRQNKEVKHKPIGVMTAVTFEMFARHSKKWHELGITRRILPLHYTYSLHTIQKAQELIRKGKINSGGDVTPLPISHFKERYVKIDQSHARELEMLSGTLANHLGQCIRLRNGTREAIQGTALLPMAPHLVLTAIAKGNAIRFNRSEVNSLDVRVATEFTAFTNMMDRKQL